MDEKQRKRRLIKGLFGIAEPGPGKTRGRKPNSRTEVKDLSDRQRSFIREYLIDQNASAAARRAGYSIKASGQVGFALLRNPVIAAEIGKLLTEKLKKTELSIDGVLSKMQALTSGDIRDIFDHNGRLLHPRKLPESIVTRVASIKVITKKMPIDDVDGASEVVLIHEIRLWGMDVQLTNLAKAMAMFGDKPPGDVTIKIVGGLPDDDFASDDIVIDTSTIV